MGGWTKTKIMLNSPQFEAEVEVELCNIIQLYERYEKYEKQVMHK